MKREAFFSKTSQISTFRSIIFGKQMPDGLVVQCQSASPAARVRIQAMANIFLTDGMQNMLDFY